MPASTLEALAGAITRLEPRLSRWSLAGRVDAGVCVPLHEGPLGLEVLLIKRTGTMRQHARELGFPGGRPDPGDRDLLDTALRETEEELGIERSRLRVLGPLSPVPTATSTYLLHPFAVEVEAGAEAAPSAAEVAVLIRMPIDEFMAGRVPYSEVHGAGWRSPIFEFEAGAMYGASAHILEELLVLVAEITERPLPVPGVTERIPWQ